MTLHWYDRPLDQQAKAGGEIGLNGVTYKGGQKMPFYVPREEMPQIDEADYPALIHLASTFGVEHTVEMVSYRTLKPHQRVDKNKVLGISKQPLLLKKSVLISEDGYVLDGNHRYWAHVKTGTTVPVIRFKLPFESAIQLLFKFSRTYTYKGGQHPVTN